MYYVIGIGGTGAKCVEAFVHLAAAGLVVPAEDIYAFFVDPDESNGSLGRAQVTLTSYTDCRKLALGTVDLFRNTITIGKPDVWSPFQGAGKKQLDQFFNYQNLTQQTPAAAHLMDVLFSPSEKATELSEGFRGHPSIGAAVMGKTVDPSQEEPWTTFEANLRRDATAHGQEPKIVLFGSIFGGTGAAGIPTIARLIAQRLQGMNIQNVSIGAVMMLPYFSFERVQTDDLHADAHDFLLNTHAALKYYYNQEYLKTFRAVYFLGERRLSPMGAPAKGGRDQQNEPHFLELYAGLAAIDFFQNGPTRPCVMVARGGQGSLQWTDLPGGQEVRRKLAQLTRFAVAFKYCYHKELTSIAAHGKGYQAPFFVRYFAKRGVSLNQDNLQQLNKVAEFCDKYLRWIGYVHESAGTTPQLQLIDYHAFCTRANGDGRNSLKLLDTFEPDRFRELILPTKREEVLKLSDLWTHMSDSRVEDNHADGVGRFVHALYQGCGIGLTEGAPVGGINVPA